MTILIQKTGQVNSGQVNSGGGTSSSSSDTKKRNKKKGQPPKKKPTKPTTDTTTTTSDDDRDDDTKNSNSKKSNTKKTIAGGNSSRWKCKEMKFAGSATYAEKGREEKMKGSIKKAIQKFKADPQKYLAIMYQTEMIHWDDNPNQQQYILLHRDGTTGWKPNNVSNNGWMTVLVQHYERCKPFPNNNTFPKESRDLYTDSMTFQGRKIHSKSMKPILPGRGMGCGDTPDLKIIGDVDPGDIYQGSVGDCWLLSGISALAEFDGGIKKLFRKTKNIDTMPRDGPNMYTVTLWDLESWKEVDIMIDERLCANPDGQQLLLGAKPSEDGELWAPYLEKALAIHCGGWDKIVGGQCTHGTYSSITIFFFHSVFLSY